MKLLMSGDSTRKLTAPPESLGCLACHGQYFAVSLPIHQKSCFQRNAFVLVPCERCKSSVRAGDFLAHTASCTGKHVPVDSKTFGAKQRNNGAQGAQMNLNSPDPDGRVRCKICERSFSQDRISKHQSVCHGKPRLKENHKPRQRSVLPIRQASGSTKWNVERPHRKNVHMQRTRPREVSFGFVSDRNNRVEYQEFRRDTSRSYPGAQAMQGGGCDTSNASSASNPLATNSLMD
ncbi:hypothetical protein GQ600_11098 [Phytophthora cactorum]|nr:hypothetical protein GQ600_11098 [Phytophthora cactorum]